MKPLWRTALAACLWLGVAGSARPASVGPSLAAILDPLARADQTHGEAVVSAVRSSPQLVEQLNSLADSGLLKGIRIVPNPSGLFGAFHQDGIISFTAQFIDAQTPRAMSAYEHLEIGARDMVFVLGYLASKLSTAPEMAAADRETTAEAKALFAATPRSQAPDMTKIFKRNLDAHLRDEARAYLQGWDDEMNAAIASNGGPLTFKDAVLLLIGSRNTRVIKEAVSLPGADRLVATPTLQFAPSAHNLQAVVSVLQRSSVPDFQ